METGAMAIAFFNSIATGLGGIIEPALYSHNIASGKRTTVYYGYLPGAGLILGGLDRDLARRQRRATLVRGRRRIINRRRNTQERRAVT
jgi:hypothetical protein